jgi:hypothetical protein
MYSCKSCGKEFKQFKYLKDHIYAKICQNIIQERSIPEQPRDIPTISSTPQTGEHVCKSCGKEFKQFKYLKDHIYARICQNKTQTLSDDKTVSNFSTTIASDGQTTSNPGNGILTIRQSSQGSLTKEPKPEKASRTSQKKLALIQKENTCELCGNTYLHKSSLSRHRGTCLGQPLSKVGEHEESSQVTDIKFSGSGGQMNMKSQVQNIATQNINNSTNTMNNTINNTLNHITNNNNLSLDIKVNPFGKEDISSMTESEKLGILKTGANAFKNLLKYTYDKPENKNLYILNKRDRTIQFLNNMFQLETGDMHDVLSEVVCNNINNLDMLYDDVGDKMDPVSKRTFERISSKYQKGDKDDAYKRLSFLYLLDASAINKKHLHNFLRIRGEDGKDKVLVGPAQN